MSDNKKDVKTENTAPEATNTEAKTDAVDNKVSDAVASKVANAPKSAEPTRADLEARATELNVPEAVIKGASTKGALEAVIAMAEDQQAQIQAVQEQLDEADGSDDVLDMASKTRRIEDPETGEVTIKKAVKDDSKSDAKKYLSKRDRMKAYLDAQPKVEMYVPRDFGEKKGTTLAVQMNGYRLNI